MKEDQDQDLGATPDEDEIQTRPYQNEVFEDQTLDHDFSIDQASFNELYLKELRQAFHWIEVKPLAALLLGDKAFCLGVVYAIGEDFVITIAELAKLVRLIVLADLYRALRLYDEHWYASPVLGFLVSKIYRQEVTEAGKQFEELIAFIGEAIAHPGRIIDSLSDEYAEKYQRFLMLWKSPGLSDLFEAGRLFGEVLLAVIGLVTVAKGAASVAARLPKMLESVGSLSGNVVRRIRAGGGNAGRKARGGGQPSQSQARPLGGDQANGLRAQKPEGDGVDLGRETPENIDGVLDGDVVPNTISKFVAQLDASVQARKDLLLATKTNGELKALAATSKSGIADLGITSSKSYENIIGFGFKKNSPDIPGVIRNHDSGTFVIAEREAYLKLVRDQYNAAGNPLHPFTEKLIMSHLDDVASKSGGAFEFQAGLPGFHAEVQSFNDVIRQLQKNTDFNTFDLSRVQVSTYKVAPSNGQGQAFPACSNCSGILPPPINILTGRK